MFKYQTLFDFEKLDFNFTLLLLFLLKINLKREFLGIHQF